MKNFLVIVFLSTLHCKTAYSQQFSWVRTVGASVNVGGISVVSDVSGNVYSTGFFAGNANIGGTAVSGGGTPDIYVVKYDASGNSIWGYYTTTSTSGSTYPVHMTIDQNGYIYIVGTTTTTYGVNFGSSSIAASTIEPDVFVLKLDTNGNVVWVKSIGGTGAENVSKVDTDGTGKLFITGDFNSSTDFIPGSGSNVLTSYGGKDVFLLCLNSNDGSYNWVNQIGGTADDYVFDMEINGQNQVVLAGSFNGTADFDSGAGTFNLTSSGSEDIYLSKYTSSGAFVNALSIGGSSADRCNSVSIDNNDNLFLTGTYFGNVDFDPSASTYSLSSTIDGSVYNLCLTNSNSFQWASCFQSSDMIVPIESVVKNNVLYLTGGFGGTCDFDPGSSVTNLSAISNSNDIYLVKLNLNGSFISAHELNSSNPEYNRPADIFVGYDNSIYLTGYVEGTVDMNPESGVNNITGSSNWLGYTLKLNPSCSSTSSNSNVNSCGPYTAPDNQVFNTSGNYSIVIPNSQGCDSTISLNLTIQQPSSYSITVENCDSYNAPDGAVYSASGVYTATIPNAAGCDSVITINLTILNSSSSTIAPTACGSYTAPDGTVHESSGSFTSVIPNAAGCDSTITVNLTVNPLPNIIASSDVVICSGSSIVLSATGGVTYNWDNGVTNGVSFTPTGSGTYSVTGTSAAGCTNTDQVEITVNPLPIVSFSASQTLGCSPLSISFINTTINAVSSDWSFGNGSTVSINNPSTTFLADGCYDISLAVLDANGCSANATFIDTVCVHPSPAAGFTSSSTSVTDNQLVSFTNTSTGTNSYSWDLGDGSALQTSENITHTYNLTNEDSLIIVLIATNSFGCTDSASLVLNVTINPPADGGLDIPTGFSPNNDGENDSWTVTGLENYPDAIIQVFNRWGQVVFDGGQTNPSWDGYFQGKLMPTADYYFIVDLGTDEKINGVVTLKQ
jgi:gliding motility-associated-like protein